MFGEDPKNIVKSGNSTVDFLYHGLAEWILTALASTLVFIVFVMQVYRIPTGSMADTLRGAHFRLRCEQCGYPFAYNFAPERYRLGENQVPGGDVPLLDPVLCPNCGYAYDMGQRGNDSRIYKIRGGRMVPVERWTVYKGDQIFVVKSLYQFVEPNRWDVVVFKNPLEPKIHYIKRLIGRPGETVVIRDGDIYIDGLIARKPPQVQEEMWMPLYVNDYQPENPSLRAYYGHAWRNPFAAPEDSAWDLSQEDGTVFVLDGEGSEVQRLAYRPELDGYFRAVYAYDPPQFYATAPVASDLMIQFYPELGDSSSVGALLGKYGRRYEGRVSVDGRMEIVEVTDGQTPRLLAEGTFRPEDFNVDTRFRFANVDHQLILTYGEASIAYDMGRGPDDAGTDRTRLPEVQLFGTGRVRLSHIGLYRDLHYISEGILRATPDDPLTLEADQYFVCGDNSPYSLDGRLWDRPGLKSGGGTYREGIVPRDYMVGKAVFVHWPGGYQAFPNFIRFIPAVDGMKIIYGGDKADR